jgi:redox-sensing transcriptional repressor
VRAPRSDGGERLSRAAAHRLSLYLRSLAAWPADAGRISSGRIAEACGVSDAQVRRDLAALGNLGQRGLGYDARDLAAAIRTALGIDRTWRAVLIGVGNLAREDPAKIGQTVEGLEVEPVERLVPRVRELGVELALLTVPAEAAQGLADLLAGARVRGILNFAPVLLRLRPQVKLVTVDLTIQLEYLAFLIQTG